MAPYLKTVTSFADVPTESGVDTLKFIEASNGLVGMFDLLGSAAFLPVTRDLRTNITKIQTRYDATKTLSVTLESLVENEKSEKQNVATEGLLWLLRGLSFTCKALQYSQQSPSHELKVAFEDSYGKTLKKHHNFLVKPIFSLALNACPARAVFYEKLSADADGGPPVSSEEFNKELDSWLHSLDQIINRMQKFYEEGKHASF